MSALEPQPRQRVISRTSLGRALHYEELRVRTPDEVDIVVQDWKTIGTNSDAEILFIHGFSQAHGAFLKQVASPLARRYRLVTYDLRGHGESDKPVEAPYYKESHRWADEVQAVIAQADLKRPVLVAWSYGGRVALDYLSRFGDRSISGLVMVNATAKSSPDVLGPSVGVLRQMTHADEQIALAGTRALLEACAASPLPPEELEYMLAYNTQVPAQIRGHLAGRPAEYEATLRGIRVPALVIHGRLDRVNTSAMARYTAAQIPHAQLNFYDDAAHMPFWESSERFNGDLQEFMRMIEQRRAMTLLQSGDG